MAIRAFARASGMCVKPPPVTHLSAARAADARTGDLARRPPGETGQSAILNTLSVGMFSPAKVQKGECRVLRVRLASEPPKACDFHASCVNRNRPRVGRPTGSDESDFSSPDHHLSVALKRPDLRMDEQLASG